MVIGGRAIRALLCMLENEMYECVLQVMGGYHKNVFCVK